MVELLLAEGEIQDRKMGLLDKGVVQMKNHYIQVRCSETEKQTLENARDAFCYDDISQFIRDVPSLLDRTKFHPFFDELYTVLKGNKEQRFPLKQWNILFFLFAYKARELCVTNLANFMQCVPRDLAKDIKSLIEKGHIKAYKDSKEITRYKLTVAGMNVAKLIYALFLEFRDTCVPKKTPVQSEAIETPQLEVSQNGC